MRYLFLKIFLFFTIVGYGQTRSSKTTISEPKQSISDSINAFILTDPGTFGIFQRSNTEEGEDSVMVISRAGAKFERKFQGGVSVKWFGAKGDGNTDDTQAIIKARNYIFRSIKTGPFGSDRITGYKLYFPAGTYKITSSQALIPSSLDKKARGMVIEGDGPGLTFISFAPTTGNRYLFDNKAYLNIIIRGIEFHSTDSNNRFMHSVSNPPGYATQRFNFEHCHWSGFWDRAFFLEGSNNNSEWAFTDCGVSGQMNTFLQIPDKNSSDQFLNFWFTRMKFWPTAKQGSNFLDMAKGGSISISDSDFSGLKSGLLFALRGNIHAYGVQRFSCRDSRFELKSSSCKVLFSEWADGNVIFDGCDFGSQSNQYNRDSTTFILSYNGTVKGPAYKFANCTLIGKILVKANSAEAFRMKNSIIFDQCQFTQFRMIDKAFQFLLPKTNDRGRISVRIQDCQPGGTRVTEWLAKTGYTVGTVKRISDRVYKAITAGVSGQSAPESIYSPIADGTVVWEYEGLDTRSMPGSMTLNALSSVGGTLSKNYVVLSNANNSFSANKPISIMVPPDAVITGINIYSPISAQGDIPITFKLRTSEAAPFDLFSFTGNSQNKRIEEQAKLFFPVGNDVGKRTLVFTTNISNPDLNGIIILEYLN